MTDYWTGEFKTTELARLREAAGSKRGHLAYINAMIDHYDAGGDESDDDAPPAPSTLTYGVACEIADAIGSIYLAVRGPGRGAPIDRSYVKRREEVHRRALQAARTRRQNRERAAAAPVGKLLNPYGGGNPDAADPADHE